MDATHLIDSFRVDGKVAVVVGAGSGIGRASALALAGAGATVVCADLAGDAAEETAGLIGAAGGAVHAATVDIADRLAIDSLAAQVVEEHGGLHVWVNTGATMVEGPFLDLTEDDLDRIISVNLKGTVFGCQAAGRIMATQEAGGSIINFSSGAADTVSANISAYALCKAAVVQITKNLAFEIGKKKVRVNAVAPGFVLTGMTSRYFVRPDGSIDEEMRDAVVGPMKKFTPLRDIADPEDIATSVLFLASDASAFITGQVLRPNGGVAMS
jgi:3-oxoacyl-[acyl-carrier protein] reductase